MTLKGHAKFKGKLTHGLKNDVRNLVNFQVSSQKSENLNFNELILSKAYKVLDEKSTEELCLMTLKSEAKFEEKLTLRSKNDIRNLVNFNASSGKSENFTLMGSFLMGSMFEPKKCRGVMCHNTEE